MNRSFETFVQANVWLCLAIVVILMFIIIFAVRHISACEEKLSGFQLKTAGTYNRNFVTSSGQAEPFIYGT